MLTLASFASRPMDKPDMDRSTLVLDPRKRNRWRGSGEFAGIEHRDSALRVSLVQCGDRRKLRRAVEGVGRYAPALRRRLASRGAAVEELPGHPSTAALRCPIHAGMGNHRSPCNSSRDEDSSRALKYPERPSACDLQSRCHAYGRDRELRRSIVPSSHGPRPGAARDAAYRSRTHRA